MTINEFISQRFQSFGIQLPEADILDISLKSGLDLEISVSGENIHSVTLAIVNFIPDLLLRYSSFTEGDLSMSWANVEQSIKTWYALRCSEYGIEDSLSDKPKVTFW